MTDYAQSVSCSGKFVKNRVAAFETEGNKKAPAGAEKKSI